jgi:pimeloyl-ACP methyl ester carboxylesterase
LTVTCSETVPRITEDDIAYHEPVASDVPVLILSGELDAATSPQIAVMAARSLPNSRHIVMRNAAHTYGQECPQRLIADFLSAGSARDLDVACVPQMRRPPFVVR